MLPMEEEWKYWCYWWKGKWSFVAAEERGMRILGCSRKGKGSVDVDQGRGMRVLMLIKEEEWE